MDQENIAVNIPTTLDKTLEEIQSLIVHELGTHVWRRLNAERSQLSLLQLGLDRYEAGEEGVATVKQRPFEEGEQDFSGFEAHFAISLAYGLDKNPKQPRSFREVFDILEKHFYLKDLEGQNGSPKNTQKAKENAQKKAWLRTVRTFRGSDCKGGGICFTKDIIYREGNIGAWKLIGKNPDELLSIDVGKFDPANLRHIWILTRLGIKNRDLIDEEQKGKLSEMDTQYSKMADSWAKRAERGHQAA